MKNEFQTNTAMKTIRNFLLLLSALLAFTACEPTDQNQGTVPYANTGYFNHDWAMDKVWEDGQAEVAHYDAERVVYGKVRRFSYAYITVKEEFNKAFNVKTDDYQRDDLFSVMKVNKFASFQTDNYPYHYLSSLFFERKKPEQLYKFTHTAQEWCGNTFKQFSVNPGGYDYDYNSYFDGAGDGKMELNGTDLLWEDQLSYVLRALRFEEGLKFSREVVESQVNTRARRPTIYKADFVVTDAGDDWQVTVTLQNDRVSTYHFAKAYPHLMTAHQRWDGFSLKLHNVNRYQYWR